jgi:DNA-binding phage protein
MGKAKTLKKQSPSLPRTLKKHEPNTKLLANKKLVIEVLVDSLLANDLETFRDVLIAHLRTLSKTDFAKKTGLGRRTIYDMLDNKKFDPRLSTISSILSKIAV